MKRNKLIFCALALLGALTATTVTSCGDDVTVIDKYTYYVEFNSGSSYAYDDTEKNLVLNDLKKVLGYDGTMYKSYSSNQDARMKAECENVLKKYTGLNLTSLLLSYTVYSKYSADFDGKVLANYTVGRSKDTPYSVLTYKEKYDNHALADIGKSICASKLPADTLRWKDLLHTTYRSFDAIRDTLNNAIKDVTGAWNREERLKKYDKAFFEAIAAEHVNDSLLIDFEVAIIKSKLPEGRSDTLWSKVFKANINWQ